MVRKEQNLVLIHEFEEATKARQEVERLEQEETEKAQQRAEQEAFRRREALVAQHKNALSRVDEYEQKILNDLAVKYSREEQNLRTRLCKLTIDREKGNFREPTQSTLKESPRTAQIPMALTTPRTRKKLLSFRNSTTAPKLGLKPIRTRPHTSLERVRITI